MNKQTKEVINLSAIKTDNGVFVKRVGGSSYSVCSLLINGEVPTKTFSSEWCKVSEWPSVVERKVSAKKENYRFELKAELLADDGFSGQTLGKMKPVIPREECQTYDDYCNCWEWTVEYKHLASLYDLKFDVVEQTPIKLEFKCSLFCEIANLEEYAGINYEVLGYYENSDKHQRITDRNIQRRAIDTIIYPNILHPSCTAIMSSDDLFKIIRLHVKQNIDYNVADITSDYKFCFTVEKRLVKPDDYALLTKPENNRRLIKNAKSTKCVIFEMTPASDRYKGYTVLPKISAKNNRALKRKIDRYLKNLMEFINEPVVLCEKCNGTGITHVSTKFNHPSDN